MGASPTAELPDFQRRQYAFAAHIRDPESNPAPQGVEDRRLAIYRELFFNNLEGFLSGGFPVLRAITPDERWLAMARDFFARHRCRTPLFPEIGKELLDYLAHERDDPADPPFLRELAHYEWVELALSVSDADRDPPPADPNGDLLDGIPVVSPLAWALSYRYPVHRIGPDFQPAEPPPGPTHLLVYRDRQDQVRFLEINAVTRRLLELLEEDPDRTGRDAVQRIAEELSHPRPEAVLEAGRGLLLDLRRRHVLLGARP